MFPCNECSKLIIQAGIKEVVYQEAKVTAKKGGATMQPDPIYAASAKLLDLAGVRLRQFTPSVSVELTKNPAAAGAVKQR